ncbi:hypothetical protein EQG64_20205 [Streptomyces sp. S6]|nr:hypothetical protein EQG64_20205 [Streptomyces sp. S6]
MTDDTTPAGAAGAAASRPPFLKRLVRSRVARAVTVAGLVGVLLGAGTVAWRTDTLPLLSPGPCWDTFDDALVERVFGDRETVAEAQRLQTDPNSRAAFYGQCRITSYKDEGKERAAGQLTVQVRRPAGYDGQDMWPAQFLGADMVPARPGAARHGLAGPGLAGPARELHRAAGHPVRPGRGGPRHGRPGRQRDRPGTRPQGPCRLAEAVVTVTNGVLRKLGCSGTYPAPSDKLPDLVGWQEAEPGAFCGSGAERAPPTASRWGGCAWARTAAPRGPARPVAATRRAACA